MIGYMRRKTPVLPGYVAAALIFCVMVPLFVLPVQANPNQIWPSDDSGFPLDVFPANEIVYVTGDLDRTSEDPSFPYTARVYVTQNRDEWHHGQGLTDVSGSYNVVIGNMMGSAFMGEIVWLPMLVPGYYDLVLDENKNGIYDCDAGTGVCDVVLGDPASGYDHAFSVIAPTGKPVVDKAQIKGRAQDLANRYHWFPRYLEWSTTALDIADNTAEFVMQGYTVVSSVGLAVIVTYSGQALPGDYNDVVMNTGQQIIENLCTPLNEKYQALANDPPDPHYQVPAVLGPVQSYSPVSDDGLAVAQATLSGRLSEQAALTSALTASLEKLDGAQAADDDHYILVQAGYVKKYADLLNDNYRDSIAAIDSYLHEIEIRGGNHVVSVANITAFKQRIGSTGFSPEEIQEFQDAGLSDADITSLRQQILAWDTAGLEDFNEYRMWQDLADSLTAGIADVSEVSEDAEEVILYYQYSVDTDYPVADAGGPYIGFEGVPMDLSGTGSWDHEGDVLQYAWDCNGDGIFNDATGPVPSYTWDHDFSGLVGLLVTDSMNLNSTAYARVTIRTANQAPLIVSLSPTESAPQVEKGQIVTFFSSATDPEHDPLLYTWTLNGTQVSDTESWSYTGSPADHGAIVRLKVSDTNPYSADTYHLWRIVITEPLLGVVPLPGYVLPPTDPDKDGICEDLNANGRLDFADVVLYFNQMTWIAANEPVRAFDLNANGRIDFADIVALFNEI